MIDESIVNLSRLQFGLTAMYHFIFVPLTLGLSFLLAIMESVYVLTNKEVYKKMTIFWGKLFAINFAMGVATGLTLEFQFGTNWAFYSYYVGDIFGVPLAIEGLMAFFLESTMVGLFFFGWNRLSKAKHLAVTWLLAIGTNLSALWILIANAWMQHPIGSEFNFETMRMELSSLAEIFFNPVAQVKFVHTVAAGYVTGATFVLAISSYYLLKGRHREIARRSFAVATGFGLASVLSVLVLGDESGYNIGESQKTKLAVIEAVWDTEPAPAAFTLFGIPDNKTQQTKYAIRIPYALGIIATRSFDTQIDGIKEIINKNEARIRQGIIALQDLDKLRKDPTNQALKDKFGENQKYMGYGLLVQRYTDDIYNVSEDVIIQAANDTVPEVWPVFWSFRIMVGAGLLLLAIFLVAFFYNTKQKIPSNSLFLRVATWALPLPWIAIFCGWFVAEYGRQPWVVAEILPTFKGVSSLSASSVYTSMGALIFLYTLLLVVELKLMLKYIRKGPEEA